MISKPGPNSRQPYPLIHSTVTFANPASVMAAKLPHFPSCSPLLRTCRTRFETLLPRLQIKFFFYRSDNYAVAPKPAHLAIYSSRRFRGITKYRNISCIIFGVNLAPHVSSENHRGLYLQYAMAPLDTCLHEVGRGSKQNLTIVIFSMRTVGLDWISDY